LLFIAASSLCLLMTLVDATLRRDAVTSRLLPPSRLVAELGLTDLALFTDARYIRHLSQSDLHAPFQDHPLAMEHFPSGSLVQPPMGLTP